MCHGSKRAKLSAFANAQRGSPNAAGGGGGSAAGSREQPPASPQGRAVAERAAGPTAGAGLALPPIQPVAPAAGAHAAVAAAAQAAVGAAAQDVAPVQQQGGGQAEQLLAYLLGRGPAPHLPSLRELLAQYPVALPPEPVQPSAGMAAAAPLAVPLPLPLLAPPLHIARPYSTMLGVDLGALCELLEGERGGTAAGLGAERAGAVGRAGDGAAAAAAVVQARPCAWPKLVLHVG